MAGLAVVTAILAVTVKQYRPELGIQVSVAGGAVLLLLAIAEFSGIAQSIRGTVEGYGIGSDWLSLVVKVTGIAYIAQLAAQICTDMGEGALALKAELCGRLLILASALPYIITLLNTLTGLIRDVV